MSESVERPKTRRALLARRGIVVVPEGSARHDDATLQALELELAALGYVPSGSLRERLRTVPTHALSEVLAWLLRELAAIRGSDQQHVPLFRRFPDGVPVNTFELWVDRVLVHFFQAPDTVCLHCDRSGTTHVLHPCLHVVCDHCFDGASYSACPICGAKVDPETPFLLPAEPRQAGAEDVRYEVLRLRGDVDEEAQALFRSLCLRTQALSPPDRAALVSILEECGERCVDWLPASIPLRENIAQIFGTLFDRCDAARLMDAAAHHMSTATDVLRFVAAYSGADPSLQPVDKLTEVSVDVAPHWWVEKLVRAFGGRVPPHRQTIWVPRKIRRFPVAKLRRPLRRALLELLERLPEERLCEDMLRHRSYWVWVGEFLHPHEYVRRYPKTARAFQLVRRKAPDGTSAPKFRTFHSRVEAAADARDPEAMATVLSERPGEFARRLDHVLRLAVADGSVDEILAIVEQLAPRFPTPLLMTLLAHFRTRMSKAPVRIYFPKGGTATGISEPDRRDLLPRVTVDALCGEFERVLLERFGRGASPGAWIVDERLADVTVPFNERTSSSSTVALTRGSRIDVPPGKLVRLFLHWCEPSGGHRTDLDLSVAFYDAEWTYKGVCSYYQLKFEDVASSSGDFTSAPAPLGATEFVDVRRAEARALGVRYAVMVVNAYSGLPFSQLDRAFAGLMLRDDDHGLHFDPRTVELKFQLSGAHGVFLPFVLDLESERLHWLDTYSKGEFVFNNVETSNRAVVRLCPEAIAYYEHGCRATMLDLGLLHAASRGRRVVLRGEGGCRSFDRADDESPEAFLARLRSGEGGEPCAPPSADEAVSALLFRGDRDVAPGSEVYALFRERLSPTWAASDLLA